MASPLQTFADDLYHPFNPFMVKLGMVYGFGSTATLLNNQAVAHVEPQWLHPGLTSQEIVEIVVLGARCLHRNSATFDWFQVPKVAFESWNCPFSWLKWCKKTLHLPEQKLRRHNKRTTKQNQDVKNRKEKKKLEDPETRTRKVQTKGPSFNKSS